jgi:hypothetical protein
MMPACHRIRQRVSRRWRLDDPTPTGSDVGRTPLEGGIRPPTKPQPTRVGGNRIHGCHNMAMEHANPTDKRPSKMTAWQGGDLPNRPRLHSTWGASRLTCCDLHAREMPTCATATCRWTGEEATNESAPHHTGEHPAPPSSTQSASPPSAHERGSPKDVNQYIQAGSDWIRPCPPQPIKARAAACPRQPPQVLCPATCVGGGGGGRRRGG